MKKGRRYRARCMALEAAYACGEELQGDLRAGIDSIVEARTEEGIDKQPYDERVLEAICASWEQGSEAAVAALKEAMPSDYARIGVIERCCMLLALIELRSELETPRNVAISQWVEASKEYGSPAGYKMVNSVLDGMEFG